MTAEEKWDKLRAHVVVRIRHTMIMDSYDEGYEAGLLEVKDLIRRFDRDED